MISFKSALGQSCIASGFDASPTVFFTTTFTMKELDSLSSAVSGITISISSTGISPEGSSTLSDTSDINGEVFFSIFYTAIGSITINLNCNTVEVDTLITTSVIPVLTFGSNILVSSM